MKKLFWIIPLCLLLISGAVIYIHGYLHYKSVYPPNYSINNYEVHNLTPEQVNSHFKNITNNKYITIKLQQGEHIKLTYKDCGVTNKADEGIEEWNPFLWFVYYFQPTKIIRISAIDINHSTLTHYLNTLECLKHPSTHPSNAYFYRHPNGEYELIPHEDGDVIIYDTFVKLIETAIKAQKEFIDLRQENCYYKADIVENEEMNEWVKQANAFINTSFHIDLGAGLTIDIPRQILIDASFVDYDGFHIDNEVIKEYLRSLQTYNTYKKDRIFHTAKGDVITLKPSAMDTFDGWMIDTTTLETIALSAIQTPSEDCTIVVPWIHTGKLHGENNDFGNTYIEISIEQQMMWLFVNGECVVETPVVTGCIADHHDTPKGMFVVLQKATDYTMHGSYGTAFCHYFVRATWTGIAIHDASWRTRFGGTIYQNSGSHGCINTPSDQMSILFEALKSLHETIPIIIY